MWLPIFLRVDRLFSPHSFTRKLYLVLRSFRTLLPPFLWLCKGPIAWPIAL